MALLGMWEEGQEFGWHGVVRGDVSCRCSNHGDGALDVSRVYLATPRDRQASREAIIS